MAIKFYRSNYDEFNPDNNGGDITDTQIETDVLNSILPAVRPRTAEIGGDRYFKFFIKTDEDILSIGIDVASPTTSPTEDIYLTLETKDDHSDVESDLDKDNLRVYGGFILTDFDRDKKQITVDRDVTNYVKVDDNVTIYNKDKKRVNLMFVKEVSDDGKTITFKEFCPSDIEAGYTGSSSIYLKRMDKDDYIGVWIKEKIGSFTKPMEDPLNVFKINVWYDIK